MHAAARRIQAQSKAYRGRSSTETLYALSDTLSESIKLLTESADFAMTDQFLVLVIANQVATQVARTFRIQQAQTSRLVQFRQALATAHDEDTLAAVRSELTKFFQYVSRHLDTQIKKRLKDAK